MGFDMRALLFTGGLDFTAGLDAPTKLVFFDYGQRPAKGERIQR